MPDVNEPVRRGLLLRTALSVLADAGEPVKRAEVMRRVAQRTHFTSYEAAPFRDGDDLPRWSNHLAWASTDMKEISWIEKTPAGWLITQAGREALATHPADGEGLDVESGRAYREAYRARRVQEKTPPYAQIINAALEFVEPGQWTTYSDLAVIAGTNAQTVGNHVAASDAEAAHRVLGKDGHTSPGFTWKGPNRTGSQRQALEDEGVHFDATGAASEAPPVPAWGETTRGSFCV